MDVLTLRGVLTLDKSEYDRGLETADQGARSFGGRFSKAMKVGAVAVAALGAATAVAGKKLVSGAMDVAKYGDHVDKMSQKIGISAEAYQKWDYVMQRAGGNVDQLKMGMKTLSQQAEKNSDAFQKLGISQEEVKSLNQEQLFERTIKGLSDMEAGTERTALATQLLGRAGADMGPLLNQGSDAIEEQMEIAEKYGMVMPDATVKASAAFEDSLTTLQMTTQGLKNRLLGELLPSMTKVTDGLAKMFIGDMSGLDDIVSGVKGFISKIGEMAPKVLEAGGKIMLQLLQGLVQKIPEILAAGGELMGKLLEGFQNAVGGASETIANIVVAIGQFLSSNAPKLLQAAITLMVTLAQGLLQALPTIIASIPQIISGIVQTFASFDWLSIGISLIQGIANGISAAGGALLSIVQSVVASVAEAVSSKFRAIRATASSIWNAIKTAITTPINAAKSAVDTAIDKIKSKVETVKNLGKKAFNILTGLHVPKIHISGGSAPFGIGGKGTKPSISVDWNKKAYNNPFLFTSPTVLQGFGDGVGGEIVYGKKNLMNDITEAVSKNKSDVNVEELGYIIGEIVGQRVTEALESVDITLDRRTLGKFTRQATGVTL